VLEKVLGFDSPERSRGQGRVWWNNLFTPIGKKSNDTGIKGGHLIGGRGAKRACKILKNDL